MNKVSAPAWTLQEVCSKLCAQLKTTEADLVETLIEVKALQIHQAFGLSMFRYAVEELHLTESQAYAFGAVAKHALEFGELRTAIRQRTLSVSKAIRMVAGLNRDNAQRLVAFAETHTQREIDVEMAKIRPRGKARDQMKPLSEEWDKLECSLARETSRKLKRLQDVLSSKLGWGADLDATLDFALSEALQRHDPVEKAKRRAVREEAGQKLAASNSVMKERSSLDSKSRGAPVEEISKPCLNKGSTRSQMPVTAQQKHAVHLRDQGQCTFTDPKTHKRCTNERWLHIHHIHPRAQDGGNDPHNLQTLCSRHHDFVHQLNLPLEGQANYLREPQVRYG